MGAASTPSLPTHKIHKEKEEKQNWKNSSKPLSLSPQPSPQESVVLKGACFLASYVNNITNKFFLIFEK